MNQREQGLYHKFNITRTDGPGYRDDLVGFRCTKSL